MTAYIFHDMSYIYLRSLISQDGGRSSADFHWLTMWEGKWDGPGYLWVLWETWQTSHQCGRHLFRSCFSHQQNSQSTTLHTHSSVTCMCALSAETTCFRFYITHTHRETLRYGHTYYTHRQCNSSYSSCGGVPSLVMSSCVWSFRLDALLLEEKKTAKLS